VVLYGCETWSLTLREEHRLRVFENRVLRRKFGLKRDEVIGCWGKVPNEEPRNLYSSPSIIRMMKSRMMRWAGHEARMGEKRNAYKMLWEIQKERDHWVNNIKMNLREIGWDDMDWIDLAQDRDQRRALVNTVMNLRVP
jgi:hypothetical protein